MAKNNFIFFFSKIKKEKIFKTSKGKNPNDENLKRKNKMKTEITQMAKVVGLDGAKLKVLFTTKLPGMVQVFKAHGYEFIGFNRSEYCRAELYELPKFRGLVGPMGGDDGIIMYETDAAYIDISSDIS